MADVVVNAEYEQAANRGFRPLVTYISQNNIAVTAPAVQRKQDTESWVVSFIMPANAELSKMPIPKDAKVTLREVKEHQAAAIVFRGITTWNKVVEREAELRAILEMNKIKITGPVQIARFDPPWKPGFMRHNEVIVPIQAI